MSPYSKSNFSKKRLLVRSLRQCRAFLEDFSGIASLEALGQIFSEFSDMEGAHDSFVGL